MKKKSILLAVSAALPPHHPGQTGGGAREARKTKFRAVFLGAALIALQLMACQTSDAGNFSIEIGSADVSGALPPGDDVLSPGFAVGTTPGLVISGIGGSGGIAVEVDGFTYGRHFPFEEQASIIDFSVDAFASGVAGSSVAIESALGSGHQNYDVYRTNLATAAGTNVQIFDGDGLPVSLAPPLGMIEPQSVLPNAVHPGVDGYDSRITPGRDIYWAWEDRYNPAPPGASLSGADVLISTAVAGYDGAGTIFAAAASLGLVAGSDNIDALEVFDYGTIGVFDPGLDIILFSLDPASPSLGGGFTPGDVLTSTGGGAFGLAIFHGSLGLTAQDNLTALSVVPEPSAALFCLFAAGLAAARRRRRS